MRRHKPITMNPTKPTLHTLCQATGLSVATVSRALAGLANGVFIFCLPGSTGACRLAWSEILRHQLNHATKPCNLAALKPRLHER